jgi:hypothetical protein
MSPTLPASLALLLASTVAAQGGVGLGFRGASRYSTVFSPASIGNGITEVAQIALVPHPNGQRGLFLGGLSVRGLSAAMGGMGGLDVLACVYDRNTETVTVGNVAATFNTSGDEYSLVWGRNGLYAVADRPTGPFQATAATVGGLLGAATPITGVTGTYVDPSTALRGGAPMLVYDAGQNLAMQAHDVAGSRVVGPTFVVATETTGQPHSPFALHGADGEAQALVGALFLGGGNSDWTWSADLDPTTKMLVQRRVTNFENNGCEAGGRVYIAESLSAGYQVQEHDVSGLLGDTVSMAGGRVDLTAFSPTKTAGAPDVTTFLAGFQFAGTPVPVPLFGNDLGLDLALPIVVLGSGPHDNQTGRVALTLTAPPMPAATIPLQALTFDPGSGRAWLTNTAALRIVP